MPPYLQQRFSRKGLLLAAAIFVIAAAILFTASSAPARDWVLRLLKITWTPSSVEETVLAGETKRIPISFTNGRRPLKNVVLRVPPELEPFVEVMPSRFDRIGKRETVTLTLIISAPTDALPEMIRGDIRLFRELRLRFPSRAGIKDKVVSWPVPLAERLPVTINVEWQMFANEMVRYTISVPPEFRPGDSVGPDSSVERNPVSPRISETFFTGAVAGSLDGFTVEEFENPEGLPIDSWLNIVKPGLYHGSVVFEEHVIADVIATRVASGDAHRVGYYVPTDEGIIAIEWGGYTGEDDPRLPIFEAFVRTLSLE